MVRGIRVMKKMEAVVPQARLGNVFAALKELDWAV